MAKPEQKVSTLRKRRSLIAGLGMLAGVLAADAGGIDAYRLFREQDAYAEYLNTFFPQVSEEEVKTAQDKLLEARNQLKSLAMKDQFEEMIQLMDSPDVRKASDINRKNKDILAVRIDSLQSKTHGEVRHFLDIFSMAFGGAGAFFSTIYLDNLLKKPVLDRANDTENQSLGIKDQKFRKIAPLFHPEWETKPPSLEDFKRFSNAVSYLPPVGGKIPVVLGGKPIFQLRPTLTAEEQVQEVTRLKEEGSLGTAYIHQLTVQGRLPDIFKYVAIALILDSPYRNDWNKPFFEVPWGKVAPLIHDGGFSEIGLNPNWNYIPGRTDFLQRIASVHRRGELPGSPEQKAEDERLLLEERSYQRLALTLHCKLGSAPSHIPEDMKEGLAARWDFFQGRMDRLLQEYGLKDISQTRWINEVPRNLSGFPGHRYEADWSPIQQDLTRLEDTRWHHTEMREQANFILKEETDLIDRIIGLKTA